MAEKNVPGSWPWIKQGEGGGLIYNYILKTSVPKIEDFEAKSNL
jgi:hypothetical protein